MKKVLPLLILVFVAGFMLSSCDEGGVRLSNNMEKYALEYIQENKLLADDEEVHAFYDYTISLDCSEAVILTNKRILYHNSSTSDTSIDLDQVKEVKHRKESVVGDIIQIFSKDGKTIMIEIAALNGGDIFVSALENSLPDSVMVW